MRSFLTLAAAIMFLLAACGDRSEGADTAAPTAEPSPTAAAVPTAILEPSPTEAPEPTPTVDVPPPTSLYVGSHTVDCIGEARQQCLLVRQDPDDDYEFFYDAIQGFEFEPGFLYELKVLITQVEDPPADGSSLAYELVEVVSKTADDTVQPATVSVSGQLTYLQRIALRPYSTATITIIDVSRADAPSQTIATKTIDINNRQVPIPFEIEIPADVFVERNRYSLRAIINAPDGSLTWTTDTAYVVDPNVASNELGDVILVQVGGDGAPDAAFALPLTARGNEPGWNITITNDQIDMVWNFGEQTATTPRPEPTVDDDSVTYEATTEAHSVRVMFRNQLCRDDATGMPHPFTVDAVADGQKLTGCGGEPESLLTANEWIVDSVAGQATMVASRATLQFGTDGTFNGNATCNQFSTTFDVSGEGLTIAQPIAVTARACVPVLNDQEATFLAALDTVTRFDFDGTNLRLITTDGTELIASPAAAS